MLLERCGVVGIDDDRRVILRYFDHWFLEISLPASADYYACYNEASPRQRFKNELIHRLHEIGA